MALQVQQFSATIPAGTPELSPILVPLAIDNWVIESLDLQVPAGPSGLMGFAIFNNGVQWIPVGADQWLVWDDVQASWPLTGQPDASGWAVAGWNTGFYDHTVVVRFHVNPPPSPSSPSVLPSFTIIATPPPAGEAVVL